jgi:hypothetical protein
MAIAKNKKMLQVPVKPEMFTVLDRLSQKTLLKRPDVVTVAVTEYAVRMGVGVEERREDPNQLSLEFQY